jgi:gas vesicle protein
MSGYYFLKGLGVGAAVSAAVALIAIPKRHRGRTKVGKAVRSFSEIIDTIANTVTM